MLPLAASLLETRSLPADGAPLALAPESERALREHTWRNVRELFTRLQRPWSSRPVSASSPAELGFGATQGRRVEEDDTEPRNGR